MSPKKTKHATQQSLNGAIKEICNIMRRSNCAGALQYVPELTWILFLRILDEREAEEVLAAAAVGEEFLPSLDEPFRWRDWAAPPPPAAQIEEMDPRQGWKRVELVARSGAFFSFVNDQLLPYLKTLREKPNATVRQKVISEIMSGVDRTRIDTERNLLDVLDKVHKISAETTDPTHYFTLSQVYEGLLLKMGEKGNDGGQFFTPREVVRAMVKVIDPQVDETVYDPCCGTGGFLAQAFEHMESQLGTDATARHLETLKKHTFFGREKENVAYPIGLANLVLHGIDRPNIWHGNTLTGSEIYGGLFEEAPSQFDVILTNPPFGGEEGTEAQARFPFKTSATTVLFVQHVMDSLRNGGRCGIVVDEGLMFRTNEKAFTQTKRKLLDDCDLYAVVSLPVNTFVNAGAGVKTNLLFFTKGRPTEKTWYYDLSDIKVTKKKPLMLSSFDEFFKLLPTRADSERSWTVDLRARWKKAENDAQKFRKIATAKRADADKLGDQLAVLKKARPRDAVAFASTEKSYKAALAEHREAAKRAQEIENSVYDLKAVNPNAKLDEDTRTPQELLDLIEEKGKEVDAALAELRQLLL